mgnify:CR=1 FL=1
MNEPSRAVVVSTTHHYIDNSDLDTTPRHVSTIFLVNSNNSKKESLHSPFAFEPSLVHVHYHFVVANICVHKDS